MGLKSKKTLKSNKKIPAYVRTIGENLQCPSVFASQTTLTLGASVLSQDLNIMSVYRARELANIQRRRHRGANVQTNSSFQLGRKPCHCHALHNTRYLREDRMSRHTTHSDPENKQTMIRATRCARKCLRCMSVQWRHREITQMHICYWRLSTVLLRSPYEPTETC